MARTMEFSLSDKEINLILDALSALLNDDDRETEIEALSERLSGRRTSDG